MFKFKKVCAETAINQGKMRVDVTGDTMFKPMVCWKEENMDDGPLIMFRVDLNKGNVIFISKGLKTLSFEAIDHFGVKQKEQSFKELLPWKEAQHDEVLTELRSIPFEEGGDGTCMDRDKGWCNNIGSWRVFDVMSCNVLTKAYLNTSKTCYLLQAACMMVWCQYLGIKYDWIQWRIIFVMMLISQLNTCYMMAHGSMVTRCMSTWCMDNLNSKYEDLVLYTWQCDMAASDVARFECMATCVDDLAGVG